MPPPKRSQPHMPKPKADGVQREMVVLAGKRKIEIAQRAAKRNKQTVQYIYLATPLLLVLPYTTL